MSDFQTPAMGDVDNFLSLFDARIARLENGGSLPDSALGVRRMWLPEISGATIVTGFASGHGWTVNGTATGGSINLNDTSTPGPLSAQSVTVVNGSSGTNKIQKGGLALNLTGKSILVWMKFTGGTSIDPGVTCVLSDAAFTNLYIGQTNGPPGGTGVALHDPESGWYCVEFFVPDMTVQGTPTIGAIDTIRIGVNSSGAQGSGTSTQVVSFGGVGYRTLPSAYPNGVVSFTFDDALASDFTLARPTLAKYGYAGTSYVIADAVGSTGPTVAQYRQMQDELGWEVAGHAFTTTAHNTRFENLSAGALLSELQSLKGWLLANGFPSEAWASPGGTSPESVWAVARQYFTSHRTAGYITAWLTKATQTAPAVRPYNLIAPTWDASQGATVVSFKAAIDKAKATQSWLIFNFHQVTAAASSGENVSSADLDSIAAYCQSQGVAVRTISGVQKDTGLAF